MKKSEINNRIENQFALIEKKQKQLSFLLDIRRVLIGCEYSIKNDVSLNYYEGISEFLKLLKSEETEIIEMLSAEASDLTSGLLKLFEEAFGKIK